ncbi:hypothetical protein [Photobacterium leiognathi]|uniref:hypothetical protein n=1 Tax=Photobacterium leiognathi TaxID=553611 RepID=UPI002980C44C|nr:hypothetical protein [Photobacterium leiognathi]
MPTINKNKKLPIASKLGLLRAVRGHLIEVVDYDDVIYIVKHKGCLENALPIVDSESALYRPVMDTISELEKTGDLAFGKVACSSWLPMKDKKAAAIAKRVTRLRKLSPIPKSVAKRNSRALLRLNAFSKGYIACQDSTNEENPYKTLREQKWWQRGYDCAQHELLKGN